MERLKQFFASKAGKITLYVFGAIAAWLIAAAVKKSMVKNEIIAGINGDPTWKANVQAKADAAGISFDAQAAEDAAYVLQTAPEHQGTWYNII